MGACERCASGTCISWGCHVECVYLGDGCRSIFMGFGGDEGLMAAKMKEDNHGVNWRMKAVAGLLIREGILAGHTITHIGSVQVFEIDNFDEVFAGLKDGDKVITVDSSFRNWLVTLPDQFEEIFEREK